MSVLIYILAGLGSGVIAGMGMGGGTLLIPALTLLLSVDQHAAQGVNMLAFIPAAVAALIIHYRAGRLRLKESLPIMIAGLAGAAGGALLAVWISGQWLRRMFGVFLIALSIVQWIGGEKREKEGRKG